METQQVTQTDRYDTPLSYNLFIFISPIWKIYC
jgi:hypothetical protein